MTQQLTDAALTFPGAAGSAWPIGWTTDGTPTTVQDGTGNGNLVSAALSSRSSPQSVRVDSDGIPDVETRQDVILMVKGGRPNAGFFGVVLRLGGATPLVNPVGYMFHRTGNTAKVTKMPGAGGWSAGTDLATKTGISTAWGNNTTDWFALRFRADDGFLAWKVWKPPQTTPGTLDFPDNLHAGEPVEWDINSVTGFGMVAFDEAPLGAGRMAIAVASEDANDYTWKIRARASSGSPARMLFDDLEGYVTEDPTMPASDGPSACVTTVVELAPQARGTRVFEEHWTQKKIDQATGAEVDYDALYPVVNRTTEWNPARWLETVDLVPTVDTALFWDGDGNYRGYQADSNNVWTYEPDTPEMADFEVVHSIRFGHRRHAGGFYLIMRAPVGDALFAGYRLRFVPWHHQQAVEIGMSATGGETQFGAEHTGTGFDFPLDVTPWSLVSLTENDVDHLWVADGRDFAYVRDAAGALHPVSEDWPLPIKIGTVNADDSLNLEQRATVVGVERFPGSGNPDLKWKLLLAGRSSFLKNRHVLGHQVGYWVRARCRGEVTTFTVWRRGTPEPKRPTVTMRHKKWMRGVPHFKYESDGVRFSTRLRGTTADTIVGDLTVGELSDAAPTDPFSAASPGVAAAPGTSGYIGVPV